MSELDTAAAAVLDAAGRYAVITGPHWPGVEAVVEAGALHVVAPGPSTRLTVATGVGLGGRRCVTVLDEYPAGVVPTADAVALTASVACAGDALRAGWTVVQPWAAEDVASLLDAAPRPALLLVRPEPPSPLRDPPDARRSRLWLDGDAVTLVGSGAAVGPMVHLAERLRSRGIDVAAVEIAILSDPRQAPLVGGTTLLVAGRRTSALFRAESWPDHPVTALPLGGVEEADLIGTVLSLVSARAE